MNNTKYLEQSQGLPVKADYNRQTIDRFITAQDIGEKSKETYRKGLKQFFLYLEDKNLINLKREDLLEYKNSLKTRELSAYTINGYVTVIRRFFEWTESEGIYPNIAKGIKGAKKPRGFRKEALTVSQVKDVLYEVKGNTLQEKRDYALLNLLVRTGLRTIEIIRANVEDIQQQAGEAILYIQGKGRDSKDEFVLLTEETLKPIREYLSELKLKEGDPLFISLSDRNYGKRLSTRSVSRIVKTNLISSGLNDSRLTAHSLRHTAVTLSLLGGATVQEAQALARHSNINTTLIYAHNIERIGNAPERRIDSILA
jgi:integrase/recombinase XerC/integrase/recombinase XerD